MKIEIIRSDFLKAWQVAERISGTKSTINTLAGVLLRAHEGRATLEATDLKTAICCTAAGVRVSEDGGAILPVRLLGDLFKKASADLLKIEIRDEKGVLVSGRNRTRFTTWPTDDFPKLAQSESAERLCELFAADLLRTLTEGSIASSPAEDFPKYFAACQIQVRQGTFHVVATDNRRLSMSQCPCKALAEGELLLPVAGIRELQRILSAFPGDTPVKILYDGSMAWFRMEKENPESIENEQIEFSVRRVESSFPVYEKILSPEATTTAMVNRSTLLSALERIDVIVRSSTRLVITHLFPDNGRIELTGRAPDLGSAVETLDADIEGQSIKTGFNVGYLQDGLKMPGTDEVKLSFCGEAGQLKIMRASGDFLYMLMPMRLSEQDLTDSEEDFEDFTVLDEEKGENDIKESRKEKKKEEENLQNGLDILINIKKESEKPKEENEGNEDNTTEPAE